MILTDKEVDARINRMREDYNHPELYELLKVLVRENERLRGIRMENELHYLRSILSCLRKAKSITYERNMEPMLFQNGALADNIDWLDCYIDRRAQELDPK